MSGFPESKDWGPSRRDYYRSSLSCLRSRNKIWEFDPWSKSCVSAIAYSADPISQSWLTIALSEQSTPCYPVLFFREHTIDRQDSDLRTGSTGSEGNQYTLPNFYRGMQHWGVDDKRIVCSLAPDSPRSSKFPRRWRRSGDDSIISQHDSSRIYLAFDKHQSVAATMDWRDLFYSPP